MNDETDIDVLFKKQAEKVAEEIRMRREESERQRREKELAEIQRREKIANHLKLVESKFHPILTSENQLSQLLKKGAYIFSVCDRYRLARVKEVATIGDVRYFVFAQFEAKTFDFNKFTFVNFVISCTSSIDRFEGSRIPPVQGLAEEVLKLFDEEHFIHSAISQNHAI